MFVHIYSTNVSSQAMFKKIKKQLIDPTNVDRAGAATNTIVREIADQLKEIHKFHFVGPDIAWTIWANKLASMEPYQRDLAVNEPPPGKLIELFDRARTPADQVLYGLQRNASLGNTVNNLRQQEIKECREAFDEMMQLLERLRFKAAELDTRLKLMEQSSITSSELLNTVSRAVEENDSSEQFYSGITNRPDDDHV